MADLLLEKAEQIAKPAGLVLHLERISRLRAELVESREPAGAGVTANA